MSQTRDNSEENSHGLADKEGKESGTDAHAASHEPADSQNYQLNSHSNPAHANSSLEMDTGHSPIARTWA
jgi:hypothetical protein